MERKLCLCLEEMRNREANREENGKVPNSYPSQPNIHMFLIKTHVKVQSKIQILVMRGL